jgi:hypothetical protein
MSDRETKNITGNIKLETRQDNYDTLMQLVQQAKYSVDIFCHDFDGNLYNTSEMTALLKNFVISNRQATLRILLKEPQVLIKYGHHIIELRRRLTSRIHIHQISSDYDEYHQTLVLVDNSGFIYRPYSDRYEGIASLNDPIKVKSERVFFNKAWETSIPSLEMQRLHI